MLKLVVFSLFVVAVSAHVGSAYTLAPLLHSPFATSYANTYKVSVRAPLVHAAPALHLAATPALHYAAAPALHYPAAHGLDYPYAYGRAYGYRYHY